MLSDLQLVYMVPRNSTQLLKINTTKFQVEREPVISRDKLTMLALFKALVLSRLDYGSQLWSPHKICQINQIEKIQRAFTKHIAGMHDLP